MLVLIVLFVLLLAIAGAVWLLVVEVRHTLRDELFMEGVRAFCQWVAIPFRSMGSSLGQLLNPQLTVVQANVQSNQEEEERDVRD
jgi:hypothetical protein